MPEVIKRRRSRAGVVPGRARRKGRRGPSSDTPLRGWRHPAHPGRGPRAIGNALGVSIGELAGEVVAHRVDLSGHWWACRQIWKDGAEVINSHQIRMRQGGDVIDVAAVTSKEEGGYLWRGELRLWDNEALMGWYVADEGVPRARGATYFALQQHGIQIHLTGRWVGSRHDGPVITGWGAIARGEREAVSLMDSLRQEGAVTK